MAGVGLTAAAGERTHRVRSWLARPQRRARLLALFLVVHLALTVPLAIVAVSSDWPETDSWFHQLSLDHEGTVVALYSGILWGAVAALAGAHLGCPVPCAVSGPRWLWRLGWFSVALIAALVAFEELAELKDTLGQWAALDSPLASITPELRWLVVVAVVGAPLAAAAGWALYASLRRHPALALLTVLAVALGVGAALRDGFGVHYGTTSPWVLLLDDGSELMASAILAVVLVEALAARLPARSADRDGRGLPYARWVTGAALVALLAASGPALRAEWDWAEAGWTRPLDYAGPISLLEQPLETHVGQLTRIDVWGYVDAGDDTTATADIRSRLIPHEGGRRSGEPPR